LGDADAARVGAKMSRLEILICVDIGDLPARINPASSLTEARTGNEMIISNGNATEIKIKRKSIHDADTRARMHARDLTSLIYHCIRCGANRESAGWMELFISK